ncbi:MAG: hypothetical protein HXY20_04170, partial [Acidobacteria bacterium]|nr:hypothetical protein [Acidobacteriota bacterium]
MRLLTRALLYLTMAAAAFAVVQRGGPRFLNGAANPGAHPAAAESSIRAADGRPENLPHPLVVTQLRAGKRPAGFLPEGMLQPDPCEGGQVMIRFPDGRRMGLTPGFQSACDPEVSFDGERILFSGKRTAADSWNVYEIGPDGSGLKQITKDLGDFRSPLYLSTLYTLISDKPWHQIAFVSNMARTAGEYGDWPVTGIYSCRIDGTG